MKSVTLITAVAMLALSGCAAATMKASPDAYLNGPAPVGVASDKIKDDLTRGDVVAGSYIVEASLMTDPLIEAEARENGKRQLDADDKITKRISEDKHLFTENKTCFDVKLYTSTIDKGYFKFVNAKIEDATGALTDVTWWNTHGTDSVPSIASHQGYTWMNSSYACAAKKLELSKGFKLHLAHQMVKSSEPSVLVWQPSSMLKRTTATVH